MADLRNSSSVVRSVTGDEFPVTEVVTPASLVPTSPVAGLSPPAPVDAIESTVTGRSLLTFRLDSTRVRSGARSGSRALVDRAGLYSTRINGSQGITHMSDQSLTSTHEV